MLGNAHTHTCIYMYIYIHTCDSSNLAISESETTEFPSHLFHSLNFFFLRIVIHPASPATFKSPDPCLGSSLRKREKKERKRIEKKERE